MGLVAVRVLEDKGLLGEFVDVRRLDVQWGRNKSARHPSWPRGGFCRLLYGVWAARAEPSSPGAGAPGKPSFFAWNH